MALVTCQSQYDKLAKYMLLVGMVRHLVKEI